MTSSRKRLLAIAAAACAVALAARADLEPWMQSAISGSAMEAALYRAMDVPGLRILYPRPPAEARNQLDALVASKPDAELYALRAHIDEQALDFTAAEQDWQAYVARADDKTSANFTLADFYHRRNLGAQEIAALKAASALPSVGTEKFLAADQQQAWKTFPRALTVARDQAMGDDATIAIYRAWIARYPAEPAVRANFIAALLRMRRFDDVQLAIDDYKTAFPQDQVSPIKAAALLAFDEGTPDATTRALALFDHAYQPLWPSELVATYFDLLGATHTQHAFLATARAQLQQNPDDLVAASKIFAFYQQQGRMDAAVNSFAAYAASKDARQTPWSADELYTFATLLDRASQFQDAARYDFALAATPGHLSNSTESPEEAGLTGLIQILLSNSDQPIELGSGNLSPYRDIATLDRGPGYLNGILSLWLNSQNPASEFSGEEQKAMPYFHREKAAELLAVLDKRFPAAEARPALHAELIRAYLSYGQDAAVRSAGRQFLADFPHADQRLDIARGVADADARADDTKDEFALYDSLLTELAGRLQGMPLSAAGDSNVTSQTTPAASSDEATDDSTTSDSTAKPTPAALLQQSLSMPVAPPATGADAAAYAQVLERYLSRLTTTGQLPAALAVLRRELDRNPNDPLLYERLAQFLQQNNLAAQEEEVYQRAIDRFNTTSFYDKLARFYLRQRRQRSFDQLARKVVDTFQGTDLEQYFGNVTSNWPQEYLQLNLYAHKRFPHDLVFTRNLLTAYRAKGTADPAAYAQLLREHWQESPDLQAEFFNDLSRDNQLASELSSLEALIPSAAARQQDPAATRELAEIDLWRSHFEQSAPLLGQLADAYPADATLGDEAASVFRSLAYLDPAQVARAAAIEKHLSAAEPTDLDRLAAIGDIYADSTATSLNLDTTQQLAQAAPFWRRISAVHPGTPDGYLQSATVFWDYFQFDDALAQIDAARRRFGNPALYGFEAGAIEEAKRDDAGAVAEYVAAAIGGDADGQASARLLTLAARPQFASVVDYATADAVATRPSAAALNLRAQILTAQHHPSDLAPLVESVIAHATASDLAAYADFAQSHQLPHAYQAALQRETALSSDPIQQIQLQYQLAKSYEDQSDVPAAQRVIETVYSSHPKLVGVVRATVDFYWRNKQPQRAIATLTAAAHQANATLAHDYTLEAIAKSNQSGDYAGARALLQPLLNADPFNAQYLSLQAESFSLANNNAGVRDLYTATLAALKSAPLSASDRRDKIALARQGLIPALTDLKDYAGAMDQHIALISAFPEDDGTLQAAISYARLHSREPQLVAFLSQTVAASPRDSRFAIDLARVDLQFEDYAGALAAYSKAIAIRGDRADLYIARADLEEHQQSFDAACADYEHLYHITYNDPQWMEKAALARARQGKPGLAVKALQSAWLDGRPDSAANEFRAAQQLEQWNLLPQADAFAAQGVQLAGDDLLANPDDSQGAIVYARLLARERKSSDALALLNRILQASSTSPSAPSVIVQQIEKKGVGDVTDGQWRMQLVAARRQRAETTFRSAVLQIAGVVAEFYTPEEKAAFAALLDAQRAAGTAQDTVDIWIPAAQAAGLKDREAAWRGDILLHGSKLAAAQLEPFNTLEASRMDNVTRAQTLDAYASQLKPAAQVPVLSLAATAWRDAGNRQRETLDLRKLVLTHRQQENEQQLFEVYLQGNPAALLQLASAQDNTADNAANFLIAHGSEPQALKMIAARNSARPVWSNANTALIGLYFGDASPAIDAAFQSTLGDLTIGTQLAGKPDLDRQLAGDPWFYYGGCYGFLLTLTAKPNHDPEDFLPAPLELAPTIPGSYSALAQTYLDAHKVDAAIDEYRHAIELDPTDPSPDIAIAEALWSDGHRDAAIASWNNALTKLRAMVDLDSVPEEFWTSFADIANDAHDDKLGATLKPAMDTILAAYLRKNGNYRSTELLQSAWTALEGEDSAAAVDWILSLVTDMPSDSQLATLTDLTGQTWFPSAQLDGVYRREIVLARMNLQAEKITAPDDGLAQLMAIQTKYMQWLLENNRAPEATSLLNSIPAAQRQTPELETIAVLLAAKQSQLPALLAGYQSDPDSAPSLDTLVNAANTLRLNKDSANSRLLLEYIFEQKLQTQSLAAPDYLALAEARIATGDMPGALDLLHRLTLQGDLYENLDSAASLLERTGHQAEALPLLTELADGTPWNASYRLRLGNAQLALRQSDAVTSLAAVAFSDDAPYAARATAAEALHTATSPRQFSSAELTLLANGAPTPQQADQPYFVYARIAAADAAPQPQRPAILRAALACAPTPMVDWLRLRLFHADIAQNDFAEASVAIAPVLAANPSLRSTEQAADASPPAAADDSTSVLNAIASPGDRIAFLLALATMHEHLGEAQPAVEDLQAAVSLSRDAEQTTPINGRIKLLQQGIARAEENASRRPVIQSNSLEQTNLVRPRLTAASAKVAP